MTHDRFERIFDWLTVANQHIAEMRVRPLNARQSLRSIEILLMSVREELETLQKETADLESETINLWTEAFNGDIEDDSDV